MVDGSAPRPGRKTWKTSVPGPNGWMPPGIGLAAVVASADASAGSQNPEVSTAPVTPAAVPMNWRRERAARSQK